MQLKSASMKFSQHVEPSYCHFTEYKMNRDQSYCIGSNLLHSRNTKNSPFAKSIKAKRLISRSADSARSKEMPDFNFKPMEVGKESKYAPSKKIIMFGGSIRKDNSIEHNPEFYHLSSRNSNTVSRQTHVGNLRSLR